MTITGLLVRGAVTKDTWGQTGILLLGRSTIRDLPTISHQDLLHDRAMHVGKAEVATDLVERELGMVDA